MAVQDGRIAWRSLILAWLCQMLCRVYYSTGIFNVILAETFETSPEALAWITSGLSTVVHCAGIPASMLEEATSNRVCVMIGGLVACLGFVGASFASSLWMLALNFCVVTGIGCGLVLHPPYLIADGFFSTYKNLALGTLSISSSASVMMWPPLIGFLEERYAWRGCLLICAGISANICVIAALLGPHEPQTDEKTPKIGTEEEARRQPTREMGSVNGKLGLQSGSKRSASHPEKTDSNISQSQTSFGTITTEVPKQETNTESTSIQKVVMRDTTNKKEILSDYDETEMYGDLEWLSSGRAPALHSATKSLSVSLSEPSPKTMKTQRLGPEPMKWSSSFLKILTDVRFILLFLCWTLIGMVNAVFYSILPAFAVSRGLSGTDSALLISFCGFGSIFGRILTTIVTHKFDSPKFRIGFFAAALVPSAIVMLCLPLFGWSFSSMGIISGCCGILLCMPLTLITRVTSDFVELQSRPLAVGFTLAGIGIGYFVGPVIAVLFVEANTSTGKTDYSNCFYATVAFCCVCEFILMVLILMGKKQGKSDEK